MREDLVQAAFEGNLKVVADLLDAGADIDAEGRTSNPLHAAIEGENEDCVQLLIQGGADLEHRSGEMSPLAHAIDIAIDGTIQRGGNAGDESTAIVNLLLAAGADPIPGLEVARTYGSSKMIELLTHAAGQARQIR
jgi:ankyrin repeat protein